MWWLASDRKISPSRPSPIPGAVEFSAYSVLPSGADSTIIARLGEMELTIKVMGISKIKMDDKIWLKFDPQTLNLYDKESGNLIVQSLINDRAVSRFGISMEAANQYGITYE